MSQIYADMKDETNPYASPAELAPPPPAASPLGRLRAPSIGLLISAGVTGAAGIVLIPMTIAGLLFSITLPASGALPPPLELWLMFPNFILSYLIVIGAWKMRRGKSYRLAYTAALLACTPVPSPCTLLSIPFGIWALLVLHRRDVREAFARNDEQSPAATAIAD